MNREEKERLERRRRMLRGNGAKPRQPRRLSPNSSRNENAQRRSAAHPAPCRPKSRAQLRHRRQRCGPSAILRRRQRRRRIAVVLVVLIIAAVMAVGSGLLVHPLPCWGI